jgi:nucleotide-binding universal stress UspA family protein
MQSILVPTDFSANAYNAARYAIALAADIKATEIILYNAYQPYVSEDPELSMPLQADVEAFRQISADGLDRMKSVLEKEMLSTIKLKLESEYNMVPQGIVDTAENFNAGFIVMGISGTESKLEEAIIGSNAVDVSKHSEIPVIVVPAEATYSPFKKILLAVDFRKSAETTPVVAIKKLLDDTKAQLDILHVEADANNTVNLDAEKNVVESLFQNYKPRYHFLQGKVFTDAINQFALENKSDLIVVIPKKHGLFEGIFKRSHTKALVFHSHIPIMTIHE